MTRSLRRLRGIHALLLLAALVSGVAICADVAPPDTKGNVLPSPAGRVFGEKRKAEGIRNFGEVSPLLFRGGQPTRPGVEALAKMGVNIVVDARGNRSNSEGKEVRRLGMTYVAIPWHCPFPHDEIFVQFLKLLKDNPDKKIFVHCRLGDDRTGMMIASYRMAVGGWSADDAMLEMQHFGFTFDHHFICPNLAAYEHSFPSHLKRNPAFKDLGLPATPAAFASE
ncbi:MAG: tyrosine-protein phosphatase [Terriglobales bacterium]